MLSEDQGKEKKIKKNNRKNKKAANLSVNCFDDPSGNRTRVYGVRGRRLDRLTNGPVNRGDRIRTCDLCVPNAALYQTEPRLDVLSNAIYYKGEKRFCQDVFCFFSSFVKIP